MEIAVLGAGTYGSYVINSLIQRYPNAHITLFDGFGGASDKWGGQLLTYTENDFKQPDQFMKEVIVLDKKSKDEMLAKFKIRNNFPENHISDELFTKTGVWLSALHRNFFHWFKINT